jgi:hypothetical protein
MNAEHAESYQITIDTDGQIRFVNKPALAAAFAPDRPTLERASHVEPAHPVLRAIFRCLRAHTRDDSLLAAFTRRWPCRWRVAIVAGPTFGPFARRPAAIAAEIAWLNTYRL